jgi:hypothetical protein
MPKIQEDCTVQLCNPAQTRGHRWPRN